MINLHERYGHYMHNKRLLLEEVNEPVFAYGWCDNGKEITGYYVLTDNHCLLYTTDGKLKEITERVKGVETVELCSR